MTVGLFTPGRLGGLALANRIVVSPMAQYSACENGHVTDWHLMHYGTFAVSGAGLTILEATAILPEGRVSPACLGIWDDAHIDGLRRIVAAFRAQPEAGRVGIQLAHAGRKAGVHQPWLGGHDLSPEDGAWALTGASHLAYPGRAAPQALDTQGLEALTVSYLAALARAEAAGFDLIELHCAHGYLLNTFLSPLSNARDDEFGGDLEARMRYPLALFARLRAAWPADRALGVRISATDWVEGGWGPQDSAEFARRLLALGCDYVAVSSGGVSPDQKIQPGPGYQLPLADSLRQEVPGLPVMAVGMLEDWQLANQVLADDRADFIAIGRGMLFNPRWAWAAAAALGGPMRVPGPWRRCHPAMRHLPR